jgi:putative peptidoglycan lipid II flippase
MMKIFKSQQAGSAALFVSVATLLSTILGLVRDRVMAHYFGASLETDFYNYGFTIPDSLQTILIMGITASSFIPIYAEQVAHKSKEEANRIASSFLNVTIGVFTFICMAVFVVMPFITDIWLSDSMPSDQRQAVVDIARIFLIAQIAFGISKILSGILQTHKHFTGYALALLVYNPSIILGMVLFHNELGVYSAAYGVLLGTIFIVLVNIIDIMKTEYKYRWTWDWRDPAVKQIWILAIPNFLNMALLSSVFIFYSGLSVGMPEGSYSAFRYALNFESFPVSIFGISFVTAIFPYLAENAGRKNFVNFNYNIQNSLRQILYLTLPAGVGMAILSPEIIGLILGGGKFRGEEITMTASILFFYALTVPLESLWYLFARGYYALKDTWTPFWFRLVGTLVNFTISYILAYLIGPSAFSLGILCGFSLQIVLFVAGLKRKVPEFDLKPALISMFKLSVCALIMAIAVWLLNEYLKTSLYLGSYSDRMQYLVRTVAGICTGAILYIAMTYVFRCADFSVLQRVTNRILRKKEGNE